MKTTRLLSLTLLSTLASAQVGTILDSSQLPQCAFSCQTLLSAQQLCVPPVAPSQDQATYQTCFCNSNYLVGYKAGAVSPTCDDACSSDNDRKAIQQWFVKLCSSGAVVTPQGNGVVATLAGTATGAATATTAASGARVDSSNGNKSWISNHYQWVIMIVVLLFTAVGAVILGIWLKRRHDLKWATGGYARESMLRTQDIANSLSNRHPVPAMANVDKVHVPMGSKAYGSGEYLAESSTMSGGNRSTPDPENGHGSRLARPGSVLRKGSLRI